MWGGHVMYFFNSLLQEYSNGVDSYSLISMYLGIRLTWWLECEQKHQILAVGHKKMVVLNASWSIDNKVSMIVPKCKDHVNSLGFRTMWSCTKGWLYEFARWLVILEKSFLPATAGDVGLKESVPSWGTGWVITNLIVPHFLKWSFGWLQHDSDMWQGAKHRWTQNA